MPPDAALPRPDGALPRSGARAPLADDGPLAPVRVAAMLREALGSDPATSLLGRHGPRLATAATALYVVVAIGFATLQVATALALIPLVLAALTLSARLGALVAAVTYGAAIVGVAAGGRAPGWVDLLDLAAFGAVSLALRLVVVRLTRGMAEIERTAAETAVMQAQVDEAREATERWVGQLEVAQRAAARMASRASVRDVAATVADEIRSIVDYHACRVYVLEDRENLVPVVAAGDNGYETIDLDDLRLRVGEGFGGWVAATGRPLLVGNAAADPRGVRIPGTDAIDESMVVVPMRYDERVTGVIALSKLGLHQFDLADVRILSILADQAATAIESTTAVSSSKALAEDLGRIADLSSALSRSLDSRQVADLIAQHMAAAFGADECAISSWDRAGDRLLASGHWPPERLADQEPSVALAGYPETRRVLEAQVSAFVSVEDPAADPAEVAFVRKDGHVAMAMLPLVAKGETMGLVELLAARPLAMEGRRLDLARAMAHEAAMALGNARLYETARALADRDPLTGFFNHRFLHERLGQEILRAQRSGAPLALLMIDLDDFKLVNDTLGHVFGDEVLRWAAAQIRGVLRGSDVAARYGGDEFAAILPDTPAAGAHDVGERIVAALRERPHAQDGRGPVPVGASVGVAAYPADGRTAAALIAGADAALYRVKRAGGGGVDGRVRRRLAGTAQEEGPQRRRSAGAG